MSDTLRARVLAAIKDGPHTFYTLSARLVAPFTVEGHESLRAVFNGLVADKVIAPVPTAATVPHGPLTAVYALAV